MCTGCVRKYIPIPPHRFALPADFLLKKDLETHRNWGKNKMGGHVARMGYRSGVYGVLVGKPEGKSPFGRERRRWEDNINMDLQEVRCGV